MGGVARRDDPLDVVAGHAARLDALAELVVVERARRDEAIAAAYRAGVPIIELATVAGLTASRVSAIVGYPHQRPGRPRPGR